MQKNNIKKIYMLLSAIAFHSTIFTQLQYLDTVPPYCADDKFWISLFEYMGIWKNSVGRMANTVDPDQTTP